MSTEVTPKQQPISIHSVIQEVQNYITNSREIDPALSIFTTKDLPFIVIGHGNEDGEENNLSNENLIRIANNQKTESEYQNVQETGSEGKVLGYTGARLQQLQVPWSEERIVVEELDKEVVLTLPRNTQIVGRVSDEACLVPNSLYGVIRFCGDKGKKVKNLHNVKGIIYPTKLPEMDAPQCWHLCKYIDCNYLKKWESINFVHTGICLAESTDLVSRLGKNRVRREGYIFQSLYNNYNPISLNGEDGKKIHKPYKFKKLPEKLEKIKDTEHVGIKIKLIAAPYIFGIASLSLLVLPGVLQYFGSKDNDWGDILNEIIGSGSVLLGIVYAISYRCLNSEMWSRNALKGEFTTTNDFVARIFGKDTVREIEKMVCDPNLPDGLIAKDRNSPVRAKRDGWLSIGNKIRFNDLIKHGYVVFKEEGIVLDVVEAEFYFIYKKGPSARIERKMEDSELPSVALVPLDGNEVFEIPDRCCKKLLQQCCGDTHPEEINHEYTLLDALNKV